MATLPNMGIVLPTLGGDSGSWDDKLNAGLALVDAHDHTSGKGVQVPSAGINIDADLAFGGYGPTGLGKAAFNAVTALAAGTKTLFVSSSDNELYWRTNGGVNVKLTSGSTINVSLVGGIVGDYTSAGAEVAYESANSRYTFKTHTGTPKTWARLASGPVRIYEFNTTDAVYVELAVAAALAASYSLTLPAALPGAAALMQVSSAGVVSYSNTTTQTITAAGLNHTTAVTVQIPGNMFHDMAGVHTRLDAASGGHIGWTLTNGAGVLTAPLPLKVGDVITSYSVYVNKTSGTGDILSVRIWATRMFGSVIESAQTVEVTNAVNAPGLITMGSTGLSVTVVAGWQYYIVAKTAFSAGADVVYGAELSYTHPT
jgi:hypothetical protein